MQKKLIALGAAVFMTVCLGLIMLALGGAALLNKNGVAASNTTSGQPKAAEVSAQQAAQIQQLQSLVAQYQAREKQYQQREQQYQSQLDQANTQLQQAQSLLDYLQSRGIIFISSDGRVLVGR